MWNFFDPAQLKPKRNRDSRVSRDVRKSREFPGTFGNPLGNLRLYNLQHYLKLDNELFYKFLVEIEMHTN